VKAKPPAPQQKKNRTSLNPAFLGFAQIVSGTTSKNEGLKVRLMLTQILFFCSSATGSVGANTPPSPFMAEEKNHEKE